MVAAEKQNKIKNKKVHKIEVIIQFTLPILTSFQLYLEIKTKLYWELLRVYKIDGISIYLIISNKYLTSFQLYLKIKTIYLNKNITQITV